MPLVVVEAMVVVVVVMSTAVSNSGERRRLIVPLRVARWRGLYLLTAFRVTYGTLLVQGCTDTDDMTAPDACSRSMASMVPVKTAACRTDGRTQQGLRGRVVDA